MQKAIEDTAAKQTVFLQALFALSAKNVQAVINANQQLVQAAVTALAQPGSVPVAVDASTIYQQANSEITENSIEAKRLIEAAAADTKKSASQMFESSVETIEKEGHTVLANGLRTVASQAQSVQDAVVATAKQFGDTMVAAHAAVAKEVKAAVEKATSK